MDEPKPEPGELPQPEAGRSQAFLRRIVLLIFIINGAILLKVLIPGPPTYEGKTVAQWLRRSALEMYRNGRVNWQPELRVNPEAVNAFGPEVWPELVEAIKRKDSAFDSTCLALWEELPLKMRNTFPNWRPISAGSISSAAYRWLAQLGPDAQGAVPDLLSIALHEPSSDVRAPAIEALGNVGSESPEALSALIKILNEPETAVWPNFSLHDQACFAVSKFGPKAKSAVPSLIEWVRTRKSGMPTNEISALGLIGPEARDAVPVLADALKNPLLRQSALCALAGIGPGAEKAVTAVIEILKESAANPTAIEVLFRVGQPAKGALPVLREIESRETGILRALAAIAITRIEEANPDRALPALIEVLKQGPSASGPTWTFEFQTLGIGSPVTVGLGPSGTASWFLAELGIAQETLLPYLKNIQGASHPAIRSLAAISQGGGSEAPISLAEELIRSDDLGIGLHFGLLTIEKMGPRARGMAPVLVKFINSKTNEWFKRRAVLKVLEKIDPDAAVNAALR